MRGKKRKGASLGMVVIAMVIITTLVVVVASVVNINASQTRLVRQYLKAKYRATSATQLALGAYYSDRDGTNAISPENALYDIFYNRVRGLDTNTNAVKSSYTDSDNQTVDIQVSGGFFEVLDIAPDYKYQTGAPIEQKFISLDEYIDKYKTGGDISDYNLIFPAVDMDYTEYVNDLNDKELKEFNFRRVGRYLSPAEYLAKYGHHLNISDYHITFTSRTVMEETGRDYVHTVVLNYETKGIRSEKGGLD